MSSSRQNMAPQPAAEPLTDETPAVVAPGFIESGLGEAASAEAMQRIDEAVANLRAIAIQPLLEKAVVAFRIDDWQGAAEWALKALARDERSGYGWYLLALAREKIGDFKTAITCYESALALLPNHADVANDLGRLALRLGRTETAAQLFSIYHAANPTCAQGANNLACALRDLQDYDGAIGVIRPAILANPESGILWNTLGTILSQQGRSAEAATFYAEALRFEPNFAKARYNLANAKMEQGDAQGALVDCDLALTAATLPSDRAMMRLARSTILLCQGRVAEGWEAYEARLDPSIAGAVKYVIDRPAWNPGDDLHGKSLLLIGEQGLGDEVMFANIVPDVLEALGPEGRLTLAVEPRLIPLFRRAFPAATVGPHVTGRFEGHGFRAAPFIDPSSIDYWAPMAAPLRQVRASVDAFPKRDRYMQADPARVEHWRRVLDDLPGARVGVLWKSLKLDGARQRGFSPFEQWRPILTTPGVSFVNLQYGECQAELLQAREELGVEIWQPPGVDLKQDLDEVAALCCALDLVLGPSNATSNIGGACGALTWLIAPPSAWPLLGTDFHPWYPKARIFFARGFLSWDKLMPEIAEALMAEIPSLVAARG
ncbi:tetratricopeptide repeat protein [Phenylobacterium montanum]|uniref:Tetratricopeptide repeat protein n=1 Tax=Phenylobacterium montanum TaxID=2823693 RepID=A0A975IUS6_9CAUL|nr:tetratricopeptide repeat protein [Caulobacter sp. S6]QUD88098.1 tetratricopeptide repeat protein [Caulobacter sp. S6]